MVRSEIFNILGRAPNSLVTKEKILLQKMHFASHLIFIYMGYVYGGALEPGRIFFFFGGFLKFTIGDGLRNDSGTIFGAVTLALRYVLRIV